MDDSGVVEESAYVEEDAYTTEHHEDSEHTETAQEAGEISDEGSTSGASAASEPSIENLVLVDANGDVVVSAPAYVSEGSLYVTVGVSEASVVPDGWFDHVSGGFDWLVAGAVVVLVCVLAVLGAVLVSPIVDVMRRA